MIKRHWKIILIILLLALLGGVYYKFQGASKVVENTVEPRQVIEVTRGSITKTISTEGYIKPVDEQDLNFPVKSSGSLKVEKIYIAEGDRVEEGQLLMELDDTEAQLNYIQKLNAYNKAQIDGSRNEIEEARLQLELAQAELTNMKLTAPFAGIITDIYVDEGDYYTSGNVATLKDISTLQVEVNIEEKDIPEIKIGQKAQITLESLPGRVIAAEVTEIADEAQNTNGIVTLPVTVTLEQVEEEIKLNTSAQVDIIIGEVKDKIVIPLTAVLSRNGQEAVMKVIDGKTQLTPVETGLTDGLKIAVESGLNVGDQIVLNTYQAAATNSALGVAAGQRQGGGFPMGPGMMGGRP